MFSVILATAMTAGAATPAWGCWGCHGCHGCYGNAFSCHGCHGCYGNAFSCHGCWGCHGCGGCYGCYGGCCGGCNGSSGYGYTYGSGFGCDGTSVFGCSGCYGCGGYHAGQNWFPDNKATAGSSSGYRSVVKTETSGSPAEVIVEAPEGAKIYVDGKLREGAGAVREFTTPTLAEGREFYYTIRADVVVKGRVTSQSHRAVVRAGEKTRVRFDDATAVATTPAPARLTVHMPADAALYIDNVRVPMTSTTRSFDTPPLPAGKDFTYTLRMDYQEQGKARSLIRTVTVRAGQPVTVDLNAAATVASR